MKELPPVERSTEISTEQSENCVAYSQDQAFQHMTRRRPEREQTLYMMVDEALFYAWDALSLSIDEEHREVYYPYLPRVFDLLVATENGQEIVDYLISIEEQHLGAIKGDNLARNRAWRLAEQVLRYKKELFATNASTVSSLT